MAVYMRIQTARATTPDPAALLASVRAAANDTAAGVAQLADGYQVKTERALTAPEQAAVAQAIETSPARDEAAIEVDQKVLRALALGLWECIPNPTLTKAQLRSRILAIWRTL